MSDDPSERAAQIVVDGWDSLGVEAHGEILHMPATIQRRTKDGGLKDVPVMLRNISNRQRMTARVNSRALALKLKLDLEVDKDLVSQLEDYAILAFAIRDPGTFDQHVPDAETLLDDYDNQSLATVFGKYEVWVEMLDPRFGEMSHEQLWQTIVRVAREKNPSPLVGMPGRAQYTCIVLMAEQALLSTTAPSWVRPQETSQPEQSALRSSEPPSD